MHACSGDSKEDEPEAPSSSSKPESLPMLGSRAVQHFFYFPPPPSPAGCRHPVAHQWHTFRIFQNVLVCTKSSALHAHARAHPYTCMQETIEPIVVFRACMKLLFFCIGSTHGACRREVLPPSRSITGPRSPTAAPTCPARGEDPSICVYTASTGRDISIRIDIQL